jgi:hypothetical protein
MGRNGDEYAADLAPPSTNNSVNRNRWIPARLVQIGAPIKPTPTSGSIRDGRDEQRHVHPRQRHLWQYVVKGMLRLAAVYVDVYRKNNG